LSIGSTYYGPLATALYDGNFLSITPYLTQSLILLKSITVTDFQRLTGLVLCIDDSSIINPSQLLTNVFN
jgi:hypothetical protein